MGNIILYGIIVFILGIGILVYYVQNFKEVNKHFKYGAVLMGIIFILQIIGLGIQAIFGIITFLIAIINVCIGLHLCAELKLIDLPIFKKLFCEEDYEKINIRRYIISTAAVILGGVVFSYVLLYVTKPTVSAEFKELLNPEGSTTLRIVIYFFAVAMAEEVTFRLVIQNYVAKMFKLEGKKYWIAIVFSAFLWALAHGIPFNPGWLKFAQIFPIGIVLGRLFRKYGLESCMLAHGGFNIIMSLIGNGLIKW